MRKARLEGGCEKSFEQRTRKSDHRTHFSFQEYDYYSSILVMGTVL